MVLNHAGVEGDGEWVWWPSLHHLSLKAGTCDERERALSHVLPSTGLAEEEMQLRTESLKGTLNLLQSSWLSGAEHPLCSLAPALRSFPWGGHSELGSGACLSDVQYWWGRKRREKRLSMYLLVE